jgi:hypothetical protein
MDANNPNRIDPIPVRMSTTVTTDRQTPKTDFGDRLKAGLDTAAGAVATGVAVAAPYVPGGAILSAAVSSVTQMSGGGAAYSAGAAVSSRYALESTGQGAVPVGGSIGSVGTSATGVPYPYPGTTSGAPNIPGTAVGGGGGSALANVQNDLGQQVQDNMQLMRIQIAMQRENQVFTTVSNVLKTRHDTVKNTIANVR